MPLMSPSPRRSSPPNNPGAGGRTNQVGCNPEENQGQKDSRLGLKQRPERNPEVPNGPEDETRDRSLPYRPFREPDDAISEISGPAIGERTTTVLSSQYGWLPKPPPENSTPPYDRDFFAVFFCTCSWPFLFSAPPRNSTGAIHHSKPLRRFRGANLCVNLCSDTRTDSEASAGRRPFPVRTDAARGGKALPFPPLAALPVGGESPASCTLPGRGIIRPPPCPSACGS